MDERVCSCVFYGHSRVAFLVCISDIVDKRWLDHVDVSMHMLLHVRGGGRREEEESWRYETSDMPCRSTLSSLMC